MPQPPPRQYARSTPRRARIGASRTGRLVDRRRGRRSLRAPGAPIARHARESGGAARSFPSLLLFGASPFRPQLREPLHVHRGFIPFLFAREALQQLDRVDNIVLNRALGRLEVNPTDFGDRRLRIGRPLLDRPKRDEAERFISHCRSALRFLRNNPRISYTGRVLSTASGGSHARRATWMPHRMLPSAIAECASVAVSYTHLRAHET